MRVRAQRIRGGAPGRWAAAAAAAAAMTLVLAPAPAEGGALADELGRNEVRVYSAPFDVEIGTTIAGCALPERLDRLGYRRVRGRRPQRPGEYFWGFERFWVYRRAHELGARRHPAALVGLRLERDTGRVLGTADPDGETTAGSRAPSGEPPPFWIEPELLAESFEAGRARRWPVVLDELPEHVWRSVLAIEDARFFSHEGVDPRSVARAAIENARAGRVTQGGSTITQQLVKLRALSPRRTLGRKVSEAARALALEARHDKEEILSAYLDSVYFGHLDGVSLYGLGAAARGYFGKGAEELELGEAALLAGMIQGPNRLHPVRNPERALARQRQVLARLEALGWAGAEGIEAARHAGLPRLRPSPPAPLAAPALLAAVEAEASRRAPGRLRKGRGVVVETTLDPRLQELAEAAVAGGLRRLRARSALRRKPLSAALVAVDARSGAVLAYVGGDPAARHDDFDRARRARRQPGSTVKPFVALEALDGCGSRRAVRPSHRIADRPLVLDLPSGPWSPRNSDGDFAGTVSLERALAESLNVPLVRLARWCGFDAVAARFRAAGLDPGRDPPPAFVLGAVEVTPLELAGAYTALANPGFRHPPRLLERIERPAGGRLYRARAGRRRTARPRSAWEVRQILARAMEAGASRAASIPAAGAFGKTGTSSDQRDAWFAGGAGAVVAVVWVGLDDGSPLGLGGAGAAAPIWREFMGQAVGGRESVAPKPPGGWRLRAAWGVIE